jgi:hypothetical protein
MHPDAAKVMAEVWLHERAGVCVERLAGRSQHLVDDRRRILAPDPAPRLGEGRALQATPTMPAARLALAAGFSMPAAGAFALKYSHRLRCLRRMPRLELS